MIRTRAGVKPRIGAISARSMYGDCVAPDLDPVPDAQGVAGLGLDVGVLDEAGLELGLDLDVGIRRERGIDFAPTHGPRTSTFRSGSSCSIGAAEACASAMTADSSSSQLTGNDERSRAAIAAGSPTTIAPPRRETAPALGEHRLVRGHRDHAKAVAAVDVGRGQHRVESLNGGDEGRQVAEGEASPLVGRAHDADRQCPVGRLVGAEDVDAAHLAVAVDPQTRCPTALPTGGDGYSEGSSARAPITASTILR